MYIYNHLNGENGETVRETNQMKANYEELLDKFRSLSSKLNLVEKENAILKKKLDAVDNEIHI